MNSEQFEQMKVLMRQFEDRYDQAYIQVSFCSSTYRWGTICFRLRHNESSESDGEIEFSTPEKCLTELEYLNSRNL